MEASEDVFTLGGHLGGTDIQFNYASHGHQDFYAEQVRREGLAAYEAPTPAIIAAIVNDGPGTVLDVGAHTGLLTLLAAAAERSTVVHAFEPLAPIRSALIKNISLNPTLERNIRIHAVALSDTRGEVTFYETVNDKGFFSTSSSIEISHAKGIDKGFFHEQRVVAARLDDWAETDLGPARLKLIKIDVESHEHAVLRGGMKTVLSRRPMIVLEVLPGANTSTHNNLVSQGYVSFAITPDRLVERQVVDYYHGASNHLLCPTDRLQDVFRMARALGIGLAVG